MKSALLLTCALGLLVASSEARLGESIEELKKRYGRPNGVEGTKDARQDRYRFNWDVYVVTVTVLQGQSVAEEFARDDQREFTLVEVRRLLVVSSDPGLAWTQVDGSTWKQNDRVATWSARSLVIQEKARAE